LCTDQEQRFPEASWRSCNPFFGVRRVSLPITPVGLAASYFSSLIPPLLVFSPSQKTILSHSGSGSGSLTPNSPPTFLSFGKSMSSIFSWDTRAAAFVYEVRIWPTSCYRFRYLIKPARKRSIVKRRWGPPPSRSTKGGQETAPFSTKAISSPLLTSLCFDSSCFRPVGSGQKEGCHKHSLCRLLLTPLRSRKEVSHCFGVQLFGRETLETVPRAPVPVPASWEGIKLSTYWRSGDSLFGLGIHSCDLGFFREPIIP